MPGLTVGLILSMPWLWTTQAAQPVFRAEVYTVAFEFSVSRPWLGLFRRPYKDLSPEDVTVVLDEQEFPAVGLIQDPEQDGCYLVHFTPPDRYRDGESHRVDVLVRIREGRPPTMMPMTMVFPLPSVEENGASEGREPWTGCTGHPL